MILSRSFLTGCDENTEWQLPWFIKNFTEHNNSNLLIADFGMSEEMLESLTQHPLFEKQLWLLNKQNTGSAVGRLKKTRAIYEATYFAKIICWLDTDCEVKQNIDSIFDYYMNGLLTMCVDVSRKNSDPEFGTWFSAAVVLTDRNWNLRDWMLACEKNPKGEEEETLYFMTSEIEKLGKIEILDKKYNSVYAEQKGAFVVHHCGEEGDNRIRGMINE